MPWRLGRNRMIIVIAATRPSRELDVMNPQTKLINWKRLLGVAPEFGLLAAITLTVFGQLFASNPGKAPSGGQGAESAAQTNPLKPPAEGSIPVAFLISEGAQVIDFTGPWEVFQDVVVPGRTDHPFRLYTVSESASPIRTSGGMKVVPEYTFENAPQPKVIVIPAQSQPSQATVEWIRKSAKSADVTMSVCTGAFVLAKTGLLSGKSATTYHGAFVRFSNQFPDIQLKRGARFVEDGNLATAGGLSSGIDLALRVVERYFGRDVAQQTAYDLEYQGRGWTDPGSNQIYAAQPVSSAEHPVCLVCGMNVDPATAPKSVYKNKTYYFCSEDDKKTFDAAPDKFVKTDRKSL
jgi:putative intracellular protease/amidase/YHS domain-containing protein